jgi:pimeloyl-ACP methyl ester carboxylesterase
MKRITLVALATLFVAAAVVGVGGASEAAVNGDSFRGEDLDLDLKWRPCFEDITEFTGVDYDCATARVPLDYDKLDGGKTPIALVRVQATGEKKGSLFFNPGGPGGSGVGFVLFNADFVYPEAREHYDYIGFDPRGVGGSAPVGCFRGFGGVISAFDLSTMPYPDTFKEVQEFRRFDNRFRTQCANNAPPLFSAMSTANVARDLEALRAAVGDEQLNFAGYSYGSVVGGAYAELFPDRVGRIIIDGVLNLEDWTGDPDGKSDTSLNNRIKSGVGAGDTFGELLRLCDEAGPELCALAPDATTRGPAVHQALAGKTVSFVDPDFGPIEFDQKRFGTFLLGGLYSPGNFPKVAELVFQMEQALLELDGSDAISAERNGQLVDAVRALQLDAPGRNVSSGLENTIGVICSDVSVPPNYREMFAAGEASRAESPIFGPVWHWGDSICITWPARDEDSFAGPYGQETANPILVMSTRYDPATAWEGAVAANDALANSALVTVNGWGHVTLGLSQCATDISEAYLVDGVLPADGTECPVDPEWVPFFGINFFDQAAEDAEAARREMLRSAMVPLRSAQN